VGVLNGVHNTEFAKHARTDLPALISELREARELLRDWLVAVSADPELSGTLILCAEKRTKGLLGDQ